MLHNANSQSHHCITSALLPLVNGQNLGLVNPSEVTEQACYLHEGM